MVKTSVTVENNAILWTAFLVFGGLLWLASAEAWTNPAYTLVLMVAVFSWFGYLVRDRALESSWPRIRPSPATHCRVSSTIFASAPWHWNVCIAITLPQICEAVYTHLV
jgi:hypothetical protein